MSCDGEDSVSVIKTNAPRLKDGKLRRYKDKLFGSKWPECHAVLYQDSTFIWYNSTNESSAKGCLQLKHLAPFLAVGSFTDRIRGRPTIPDGYSVHWIVAIGTGRSGKIHWFLCKSDEDLNAWMSQIASTLPPPPQPPQAPGQAPGNYPSAPPVMQQQQHPNHMPPPNAGYAHPQRAHNQPYGQPGGNTTVVVQGDRGRRDDGFGDFGTGLMMGGMMGYGMGRWGGWGMGYGWGGYGGGFHGGFQDNDTTVVNNYYNETNNEVNQEFNDYGDAGGGDYYEERDADDFEGYDDGFDDGGFDDGGDFGGGDF